MKIIILMIHLCLVFVSLSQKQDYIWLGGYDFDNIPSDPNVVEGYRMDFNRTPLQLENDISWRYGFNRCMAMLSDSKGKLRMFSNGCAVFNGDYKVMPNGEKINEGEWFTKFWKHCAFGHPYPQSIILLDDPKDANGVYMFHQYNVYDPNGPTTQRLLVSYVDGSLDQGRGDVLYKNIDQFNGKLILTSYLTAMRHENRRDWWLILPIVNDSLFMTVLIDSSGIHKPIYQNTYQYFDDYRSSGGGTASFSPDGKRYALYNYIDQLHIYDFDRATGLFSNHLKVDIYVPDSINLEDMYLSSVEWSPNGRFVYCASSKKLHQVDTWESVLQDGVRHIADVEKVLNPFPNSLYMMVLAPDCKIYMTPASGSSSIHVIHNPDALGKDCNLVQNGIKFQFANAGALPNFPKYRVDQADKCDPTISSIFGDQVYYRKNIEIYPNPSNGPIYIKFPEIVEDATMNIIDMNGKTVFTMQVYNTIVEEIDLSQLMGGFYRIEVYPENNPYRTFYGTQIMKL